MRETGGAETGFRSRQRWLLIAVILTYALALQGVRPLYDPDEGRYTAGAISMLRTGDWMTPRWNEEAYNLTKPPLTYWAIATSFRLLGRTETAARLPNSLAFAGTILLVFLLAERLIPDKSFLAALIYATALFPVIGANIVSTDTLLTLWETLAVFGFVAASWDRKRPRWGIPLMWLGFGLAFLTKGPPGLLPLISIIIFAAIRGGREGLRRLASPVGLILFTVVGFGWYAAEIVRIPGLFHYFWSFEIVGRLEGVQNRNPGIHGLLVTYLPVVLFGLLPWIVLWFLPTQRRARAANIGSGRSTESRFLFIWIGIPLTVFILAQSRISLYLLPLMVPAALWLAMGIRLSWASIRPRLLIGIWVVCLLTLRSASLFYTHPTKDGHAFAVALRNRVGAAPREVVFVDVPSRWSLVFYLDCEVKEVDLSRPSPGEELADRFQLRRSLAHELALPVHKKLLLVRPSKDEALHHELSELSVPVESLGSTHGFNVYRTVD